MNAERHGGSAGFTLLELLVAVTLLALLSLVLVASFRTGTRIWNKADNANASENAVRAAQRLLARDLDRLYPRFVAASATKGFVDFDGTPTRLTFLSTAGQESGLIKKVTVGTAADGDGLALGYVAAAELSPRVILDSRPLLHRIVSVKFSYFGVDDGGRESRWRDTWQYKRTAPLLIGIRVETTGPGAGTWPEMVVRPRIAADVGCTFDPVSKSCFGR